MWLIENKTFFRGQVVKLDRVGNQGLVRTHGGAVVQIRLNKGFEVFVGYEHPEVTDSKKNPNELEAGQNVIFRIAPDDMRAHRPTAIFWCVANDFDTAKEQTTARGEQKIRVRRLSQCPDGTWMKSGSKTVFEGTVAEMLAESRRLNHEQISAFPEKEILPKCKVVDYHIFEFLRMVGGVEKWVPTEDPRKRILIPIMKPRKPKVVRVEIKEVTPIMSPVAEAVFDEEIPEPVSGQLVAA